jgi:hypothetical protein
MEEASMMKILTKAVPALLVAALALSCHQSLEQTSPDLEILYQSKGPEGASPQTGVFPTSWIDYSLSTNTVAGVTTVTDDQVALEFPDVDLDFLRDAKTDAALETELKKFLTFSTLSTDPNFATNSSKGIVASGTRNSLSYSVIRRDGRKVYLKLAINGSTSETIEAKIEGGKYPFKHGQFFDKDGNGEGGELFYDDWYDYSISVYHAGGTGATNIPHVEYDSTPVAANVTIQVSGTSWGSGSLGWTGNQTSRPAEFRITMPNEDGYSSLLKSTFELQKFNGTDWVKDTDLNWSARTTNAKQFYATVTQTHKTLYRLVAKDIDKFKTIADYKGGKVRIYPGSPIPTGGLKKSSIVVLSGNDMNAFNSTALTQYTNGGSLSGSSNATLAGDSENKNATLTISLSTTALGELGAISNLAEWKKHFRLGVVKDPSSGSLLFSENNVNTWSRVEFIDIASAELAYSTSPVTAPTSTTPHDLLVIHLDPAYQINNGSTGYLFIDDQYGYRITTGTVTTDGVFGNWQNQADTPFKGIGAYPLNVGGSSSF